MRSASARLVDAQPAKALLDQALQVLGRLGRLAVDQANSGKLAGEALEALGDIAVVIKVVDRLDNHRLVDPGGGHGLVEHFHRGPRAGLPPLGKRIALGIVAPHMQMGVDNHLYSSFHPERTWAI